MTMLEIDIFDGARYQAEGPPYADYARLRAEAPVYRHRDPELPAGFWAVTRYADVVHVSRHPEIFSSHERTALVTELDEEHLMQQRMMMLNQDPPDHSRLRSLVNRGFTPRVIGKLTEKIEAS